MAVVVGNTARSLLGLQRTITCRALVGKWLQNQVSTSAKLSQTSESSGEKNTKIYEMRTYYVKPKAFGKGKKNSPDRLVFTTENHQRLGAQGNSIRGIYREVDMGDAAPTPLRPYVCCMHVSPI